MRPNFQKTCRPRRPPNCEKCGPAFRVAATPLCLLLSFLPASASDDKIDRATLKGVTAVCAVVEISDQAKSTVNKDNLQAAVEGRLHRAGVMVDKEATTCLYLTVRALQAIGKPVIGKKEKPIPLYALDVRLEFLQTVTLSRDPGTKTYAPTWSSANMATVPAADLDSAAGDMAGGLLQLFANAYKSANPN
jgi:hypothetical protein